MFPNALVVRAYALRSARLWLGLRATTAVGLAVANLPPFPRSLAAAHILIFLSLALCFAELWRRHERVLIGNLGVSPWTLGAVSLIPPLVCEAILTTALNLYL
jgi:hypothetical protein